MACIQNDSNPVISATNLPNLATDEFILSFCQLPYVT
jgi:hypothetical protein